MSTKGLLILMMVLVLMIVGVVLAPIPVTRCVGETYLRPGCITEQKWAWPFLWVVLTDGNGQIEVERMTDESEKSSITATPIPIDEIIGEEQTVPTRATTPSPEELEGSM